MVLSNAERQARYRERLKQLAARGVMSERQAEVLSDVRRHLREWRRSLGIIAEGRMRLTTNNVDTTADHAAMVRKLIAQNEALLVRFDPDGLTDDGNIEFGDVTPEDTREVLDGRWVVYSLDDQGRAVKLKLFDDESPARTAAGMEPGRHVGVIARDMWSITPPGETN